MKRITKSLAVLAAGVLAVGATGGPASASADLANLDITGVGYNAYGSDSAANRNAEYVDVKNVSTTAAVKVDGLLVQDAWARGRDKTRGCNTFTLAAGVLPVAAGAVADELPVGQTLRVHMGAGTPAIDRDGVRHVYADMRTGCGYNGHIFNNGPSGSNRWADWDRAWVTLGGVSESKGYNFSFGYVAK